jgi:hypothetical protein
MISLMMEAVNTSETSVHFYQTALWNNPEESHLHTHRRENLKISLRSKGAAGFSSRDTQCVQAVSWFCGFFLLEARLL